MEPNSEPQCVPYDVYLVSMPVAEIQRPSLAIGILKAALAARGISTGVLYANLMFAEEIGLLPYYAFGATGAVTLIGEWAFARAAFPEDDRDTNAYLKTIVSDPTMKFYEWLPGIALEDLLLEVRKRAVDFVDRVARQVLAHRPRVVGCSSTFQQQVASLALLRRIKELDPAVITVIGGSNCEAEMGVAVVRSFPWVDYVFSGESEETFPAFVQMVLESESRPPMDKLPYGCIAQGDGLAAARPPRTQLLELDRSPIPDFDDYFTQLAASEIAPYIEPAILIETSRGCWWGEIKHCTFCGLNGESMNYRAKSPDRVVAEFDALAQRYGIRRFQVVDNILDMSHIKSVVPRLSEANPKYEVFYETKANLNKQQMEALAGGGIKWLQPGLETMQDDMLKLLGKGSSTWMNLRLLKWAEQFDINVTWNLLVCAPGEKDEWYTQMAEYIPMVTHYQPPTTIVSIRVDRFSPYHRDPEQWGLRLKPYEIYSHIYPPSADIWNIAYYFEQEGAPLLFRVENLMAPEVAAQHPGLLAACKEYLKWSRAWAQGMRSGDGPPVLSMHRDNGSLRFVDTRPAAPQRELVLDGLAAKVYDLCDDAPSTRRVVESLASSHGITASTEEVESVLDDLAKRKLLLPTAGRWLALAVDATSSWPREGRPAPTGNLVNLDTAPRRLENDLLMRPSLNAVADQLAAMFATSS